GGVELFSSLSGGKVMGGTDDLASPGDEHDADDLYASRRAELIRHRQERVLRLEAVVTSASGVELEEAHADLKLARERLSAAQAMPLQPGEAAGESPEPVAKRGVSGRRTRWLVGCGAIAAIVVAGAAAAY